MNSGTNHTGFAIALAWPETYCKQPGYWYDGLTSWLGVNKNNYYRAGHAALVLVDRINKICHYFDFGRYHAPFQHGRVRSAETDHELKMETVPFISHDGKTILNTNEILKELQLNPGCHGEGTLFASYCVVNFEQAHNKALEMQCISPIPYGPFRYKGSNCSRFVNTVILAGNPSAKYKFRLKYLVPFTPTPMNNVNSLNHKLEMPKLLKGEPFCPVQKLDYTLLRTTLKAPVRHPNIPENALWLSGEGGGSWFVIEPDGTLLKVARYSPHGVIECTGLYENRNGNTMPIDQSIQITYPSNCKVISIIHKDQEMVFERTVS